MTPLTEALLDRLRFVHAEARTVLEALPGDALDWVPGAGMNSVCVTVVHLIGAERFLLGDVACADPSGRNRDAEFTESGLGAENLLERLAQADTYAEKALSSLDPAQLGATRRLPNHGREVSVAWAVAHAVEHGALHVGQLQMIRQMWEHSRNAGTPQTA